MTDIYKVLGIESCTPSGALRNVVFPLLARLLIRSASRSPPGRPIRIQGDSSIIATKMGHGPILFWKHVNYAILIIPEGAVKDQDDFSNGFAKSFPSGRNTSFSMSLSTSDFPDITLFLLHFVKEI